MIDIALGVVGAIVGGFIARSLRNERRHRSQHLEHHSLGDRRGRRAVGLSQGCRDDLSRQSLGGAPARRRRVVFASGFHPAFDGSSGRMARFQNGARVFRKSISISAAAKASPRWADATATRTICSPGAMRPMSVDDGDAHQRPSRLRLSDDPRHLFFRHAGIMFEFEGRESAGLVAAVADEGHESLRRPFYRERAPRLRGRRRSPPAGRGRRPSSYPPVIGGKNAISFAPAIAAS